MPRKRKRSPEKKFNRRVDASLKALTTYTVVASVYNKAKKK